MDIERARGIVSACMAHVWYREGIATAPPPSLAGVSLRELLDANEMVGAAPAISKAGCSDCGQTPGSQHRPSCHRAGLVTAGSQYGAFMMHCDERLVAALYVAYHY